MMPEQKMIEMCRKCKCHMWCQLFSRCCAISTQVTKALICFIPWRNMEITSKSRHFSTPCLIILKWSVYCWSEVDNTRRLNLFHIWESGRWIGGLHCVTGREGVAHSKSAAAVLICLTEKVHRACTEHAHAV